MNYEQQDTAAVLRELTSTEQGLSPQEAARRQNENGPNKLDEGRKVSLIRRFLQQLADPMILVLLAAAGISGVIAAAEDAMPTDVFIILFVVLLNAVLGIVQESKAEKAIEALKEMTAATSKVLRNGQLLTVKSEELTVGDIIILEAGDAVPADARILESNSLRCEEAALTGESVPVEKTSAALHAASGSIPLGDRTNMVYMGSTAVYGRGKAVICGIGMQTEMGKIAGALTRVVEEQTPLQIKMAQLSKVLTRLVIGICLVIFAASVIRAGNFSFEHTILPSFMVAVSLAVAAVPEGLAAVVTIVLSVGVTRMSRRAAVIRRLTAVETLGCTQVICSDKTGTLTQNKMTVVQDDTADQKLLSEAMALCSDAQLGKSGQAVGEPTECALVNYAAKNGYDKPALQTAQPRIGEVPFDSLRKLMTTVHTRGNEIIQYTKGAPDELLRRCDFVLTAQGVIPMTDSHRTKILQHNREMAGRALRVLAAAYRTWDCVPAAYTSEALEHGLIFIGLCGMIDPVRPEVIGAIQNCRTAGIRPIMITGDHKDTAAAIAAELGILTDPKQAITGAELDSLSDKEFDDSIATYFVYARVQPEHKVRIVNAWKKQGKITAMTGDGVNDAPSIKAANIGIGMGITGTDVTKNVADMILGDDNFATIVYAVGEGRKIYSNIRKAIQFLLSSNMSEVITIFTATMIGFTVLKAPHLLWINLITDCFPALALGMETGEDDSMKQPPRDSREGIFAGGLGFDVVYQGLLVSILTLTAYFLGTTVLFDPNCGTMEMQGMTMAFLTMSMAEVFHSYNMRSQRGSIFRLRQHNWYLFGAMLISLILTAAVIEVPFLANLFGFAPIDWMEYMAAMALAITVIPIVELVKQIQRTAARHKHL